MKRKITSYEIALSGVSSAMAIIALVGAVFIPVAKLSLYILSAIFVAVPLTKNLWVGGIFSYLVTTMVGMLISNIRALPFVLFFGLYTLLAWALDFKLYKCEKLPKWLTITLITIIKIGFYCLSFYLCFLLMKIVVADIVLFGWKWSFGILLACGFVLFCVYDPLYRFVYKNLVNIVSRIVKK